MKKYLTPFIACLFLFVVGCSNDEKNTTNNTPIDVPKIFNQLSEKESGVLFSNDLKEDSVVNYFTYPYIYMGGGVAIGDVNNDGLQDLYFTGNMTENKLYLNQGELKFEDVTSSAKVAGDDRWMTGATMADVNADGLLDIYVSVSGKFTTKKNLLYINNGPDENGVPSFSEEAEKYGIADEGSSTQGTFFDYDKDGDLDLYVANYPFTSFKTTNYSYAMYIQRKKPENSDNLYRNNGNGVFEKVTEEAGILNFGLSLSATVGDFNNDGWEDVYVSNDFATPDFFYFNNGDGTFTDKMREAMPHTAFYGMGADASDFNNDGLLDLVQMDMTPENNRRNKANMASMNIPGFWEIVSYGMHFQYMQNALQLNQGIDENGLPHFGDISRIAGMSSTDWSWASLIADFDNDGWKDIFVTNGTRRDINNKDYFKKIDKANKTEKKKFNFLDLTLKMPSEKVDNYAFKNNGDLTFDNVIEEWGLSHLGFSNGASYADLDNDGDLDLVVNNIDEESIVYQNTTVEKNAGNYLRVKLFGPENNPNGIGAKVELTTNSGKQFQHLTMTRGFQSSVEPILHFGVNNEQSVNNLMVTWPDGKINTLENVPANQLLEVKYNESGESSEAVAQAGNLFQTINGNLGVDFVHFENNHDDYIYEILLPHSYSRNGPGLATGDVNGDDLTDFFIGGAAGSAGVVYIQNEAGEFSKAPNTFSNEDVICEDMGAVFFDADGDGDNDLYIVSGGNERKVGSKILQDRLYVNDGKGNFTKNAGALPDMKDSGSRVKPGDYDGDGDLDLFVGGRVVSQAYPLPAKSTILRNDSENGEIKFTDVTQEIAPEFLKLGLVTDALWMDFNNDDKLDLVVSGEWMPVTFYENKNGTFENVTSDTGIGNETGWWYSLAKADMDGDGDEDIIAGNLGLNYKYQANEERSFDVYAYDFDKNGKLDIVLGYFNDGVQYPVRGRQCSSEQIPAIQVKYEDYNSFADASLEDIYTKEDLEKALHYQAWNFASSYIENKGDGKFEIYKLPNLAQISCINGIIVDDFNKDGNMDLVTAGNLYSSEVETTRNDASYGCYLEGDGKGGFTARPYAESGLLINGDTKDVSMIETKNGKVIMAANNSGYMNFIKVKD